MSSLNYLKKVKEQYENYPYPERDPEDERHRLIATAPDCLDKLNYYCFAGNKDYRADFRVLVAGGGTGDSLVFLAEQLKDFRAEVVYLDITRNSMQVAKKRASIRGLTNIQWHTASLLDLSSLDIGKFDYINCSGVLHHLADPAAGLSALNSVLKEDGAMSIMVYARYGREGIYQIQDLMRRINKDEGDMDKCVRNCKKVLNDLPATHIIDHTRRLFPDWKYQQPIELYDLFLHSQDRAYTVPELYDYIENEDMSILHFLPSGSPYGNKLYSPESYTHDETILRYIQPMPLREKQAIAELMNGLIPKHTFYVAKHYRKPANISDVDVIPNLNMHTRQEDYQSLYRLICTSEHTVNVAKPGSNKHISFFRTELTEYIFKYMNGTTTLNEIYALIEKDERAPKVSLEQFQKEFEGVFEAMSAHDFMYVRGSNVESPLSMHQILTRNKDH